MSKSTHIKRRAEYTSLCNNNYYVTGRVKVIASFPCSLVVSKITLGRQLGLMLIVYGRVSGCG